MTFLCRFLSEEKYTMSKVKIFSQKYSFLCLIVTEMACLIIKDHFPYNQLQKATPSN